MANSVSDENSDLMSLEKLSLNHAQCYNRHCHCNQRHLKSRTLNSQRANRSGLSWPPKQSSGLIKASKRQMNALNVSAVTSCLVGTKKPSSSASSGNFSGTHKELAWSQSGNKTDFGDLARLADITTCSYDHHIDFSLLSFRSCGQRPAGEVIVKKLKKKKKSTTNNTDIVLTDLKSVLLAEDGDLSARDSNSRPASDCSPSGHMTIPCSQQALVNDCVMDELDELTGYFEHYFYIPKKMSEMAKMMYA